MFFPGMKLNQKCTTTTKKTKLSASDQVKESVVGLFLGKKKGKKKAFALKLFMQFANSNTELLPMHVTSRAL